MSYNVQWQQVKQDVPAALTQHKSYGNSIGTIGDALSGFADAQRAKNTNGLLTQLAQAKSEEDMVLAQASILDAIQKQGGAVDGLGLLGKMQQQQDYVTERIASEEAKLGQSAVLDAVLSGQDSQAFREANAQGLGDMSLAQKGPLAQHYQSLKSNEAAAQAAAFDQKIRAGELGVKVQKANQDSVNLGLGVIDKIASNPGKEIQVPYYDPETGTTTYQTVYQPGYGDVFEGSGGSSLLGSLSGLGGASGGKVGNVKVEDHHNVVASKAQSYGWSPQVVAGLLGNFEVEGGYKGGVGDSGKAFGIAQWQYPTRKANFKRIIGKDIPDASVAEQMAFVKWEFDNPEQAGMTVAQRDAILNAKTPEQAAELIDKYYEVSDGQHRQKRINHASNFYAGMKGSNSGGGTTQVNTQSGNTGSTNASTGAVPKGKGWQVTSEQANRIPNMMQGYKRMRAEERNIEAASYNETAAKFEFDNFLKKNNAHDGSTTLGIRTNNHNIVTHAKTNPQYNGLSAANKQKVLTAMFEWGKENQGMGLLNTKDALVRERIDKEIQAIVAAETQAEIAKELKYFKDETEKEYQEIKKTNPSATLDQVRQWASPHHNKLLKNPKGSKAEVSSSKKGAPLPDYLKRKTNPKQGMLDSMLQQNPHIKYTPNPFG